jgi:hypothetical protein
MTRPKPPAPRLPQFQQPPSTSVDQPGPAPGNASHDGKRHDQHRRNPAANGDESPVLAAYLHLHPRATLDTGGHLSNAITRYAERNGYQLGLFLAAVEGHDDTAALHTLLDDIDAGTRAVLIVGPAGHALAALDHLPDVRVLTLADVPPLDPEPDDP